MSSGCTSIECITAVVRERRNGNVSLLYSNVQNVWLTMVVLKNVFSMFSKGNNCIQFANRYIKLLHLPFW
ncbi:hypothetical protein M378DRAFT_1002200 [Amanita muscaria Koide BX008]|uniref:Uncharacterized protein n=1 Tax=Amanita muscaria (strain Koide BX008) TaxID=946122 RepID=A0A0C2WT67_AMAMK|nr:hypothetical protein M378DRAFT_1002200 [Amanita muscaria Koide BX008]